MLNVGDSRAQAPWKERGIKEGGSDYAGEVAVKGYEVRAWLGDRMKIMDDLGDRRHLGDRG